MKNKTLIGLFVSLIGGNLAFANADANRCENYAKYAAIDAYKAKMGSVQGSDGIKSVAILIKKKGLYIDYKVTISDNNEDGDTWNIDYLVQIQMQLNLQCNIVKVQMIRPAQDQCKTNSDCPNWQWCRPDSEGVLYCSSDDGPF